MPIFRIQQYKAESTKLSETLKNEESGRNLNDAALPFTLGVGVQDQSTIQLVRELDDKDGQSGSGEHPKVHQVLKRLNLAAVSPSDSFTVALHNSAFGTQGAATANVAECVQTHFPVSKLTPDFKAQIEADFARFDELCKPAMKGDLGLATGWSVEEQEHEGIKGEKARCFFVIRGWNGMREFEALCQTEEYKEAVKILIGWNSPFKMVRFCSCSVQASKMLTCLTVAC